LAILFLPRRIREKLAGDGLGDGATAFNCGMSGAQALCPKPIPALGALGVWFNGVECDSR
jgi:hypothetical protein